MYPKTMVNNNILWLLNFVCFYNWLRIFQYILVYWQKKTQLNIFTILFKLIPLGWPSTWPFAILILSSLWKLTIISLSVLLTPDSERNTHRYIFEIKMKTVKINSWIYLNSKNIANWPTIFMINKLLNPLLGKYVIHNRKKGSTFNLFQICAKNNVR